MAPAARFLSPHFLWGVIGHNRLHEQNLRAVFVMKPIGADTPTGPVNVVSRRLRGIP